MQFPDDMMAALGRFVVAWPQFEAELAGVFSRALGLPLQTGLMVFFSSMGFSSHRDLLKSATANSGFKKPSEALINLLSAAEPIATLRNDLIHGHWLELRFDHASVAVYKPRHDMRSYIFDIDTKQLIAKCAEINSLRKTLADLDTAARPRSKHRKKDTAD
jgi:hypothetical protein